MIPIMDLIPGFDVFLYTKLTAMKNTSKILLALAGGLALGAAIGILLAPDKGSETRKKIKDTTRRFGEKAKDKFRETMNSASDMRSKVEEEVDEFI